MNKIVFKITKNLLSISYIDKDISKENLNNTNIIDTKELTFSSSYIKENIELVSSFLNVIIIKRNVDRIIIKNIELTTIVLDLIKSIPSITSLTIKEDTIITYEIFLKLLENNYLKEINVYDIQPYLLDRLDLNKSLKVNVRSERLFISTFMNENDLNTYSDIFYKKHITISAFNSNDYSEFNTFIQINNYLKTITFNYIDEDIFTFITNTIIDRKLSNIKIIINQEKVDLNQNLNYISTFKKKKERVLINLNITFKIKYSDDYKKKNMFKHINFSFIKTTLIAIIICAFTMIAISEYQSYIDMLSYESIEKDLSQILKDSTIDNNKENDYEIEFIEPNNEDISKINETTTTIYDIKYDKVFEKLLEINKDTVGWLTVNNTNIDYPVVLAKDNDYYLKHDFYNNTNKHGWVFMDYHNNIDELSKNTIIYAHNLSNQKMFGTLRYALNSYWYQKTNNQIINFNTIYGNMKWQIFSIYRVPVTNDYLQTSFTSSTNFLSFIDLIKSRSIYNFNININEDDHILTLSTCSNGHDQRLVVHAKLVN